MLAWFHCVTLRHFWCSSCQINMALRNWQGGDSVCDKLFQEGIRWVRIWMLSRQKHFTKFLVEHNIALSAVDSSGNLFFYVCFWTAQQLNSMAVAKQKHQPLWSVTAQDIGWCHDGNPHPSQRLCLWVSLWSGEEESDSLLFFHKCRHHRGTYSSEVQRRVVLWFPAEWYFAEEVQASNFRSSEKVMSLWLQCARE